MFMPMYTARAFPVRVVGILSNDILKACHDSLASLPAGAGGGGALELWEYPPILLLFRLVSPAGGGE